MKRILFTLVMIAALAMVAGTAWGQTGITPYPGETYNYSLSNILTSETDALADIEWDGLTQTPTVTVNSTHTGTYPNFTIDATTSYTFDFDVTYHANETPGNKTLRVRITNGTGGCDNFINLAITVQPPTIALQITASTDVACQNLGTPDDNEDAANATVTPPVANQFTFVITPTPTPASLSGYTYDFDFELNSYDFGTVNNLSVISASSGTLTGDQASGYNVADASGSVTITVEFTTYSGLDKDFTSTISTPVLTYNSVDYTTGNSITPASVGDNVASVGFTPAIGTFTW